MAQLSNVYATALFDMFLQKRDDSEFAGTYLEQANFLRDLLMDDEIHRIISHPQIKKSEKREFFENILGDQVNNDLKGLLLLAIQKNRESFLVKALTDLIALVENSRGLARGKVITGTPLTDTQITKLEAMLSQKLGKQVTVTAELDPAVIGGILIYVDGFYIDKTIRTGLRNLKAGMLEGGQVKL